MPDWGHYEQVYGSGATLYYKGREAMDSGDLASAIALFAQSVQLDPHFKTLELLGECFLRRKQYLEAVVPLAASSGLGTKPYRALFLLAQALDGLGQRQAAIAKLTEAVQMKTDYKAAREFLDVLRDASGR